jgi:hypothetical protein
MSEIDDILARIQVRFGRIDALLREIFLDQPDRRLLPDVPLHQRGFGVMDEPPA